MTGFAFDLLGLAWLDATPPDSVSVDDPNPVDLHGPSTVETWLGAPARSWPNRPPTVVDALDFAVRRHRDAVAFVDPAGAEWRYDEFAELVAGGVERLGALGVGPGDRFAVAADNGMALAVALFAAARSGAVMVGLNTRLSPAQWTYQIDHSGAAVVLATAKYHDDAVRAVRDAGVAIAVLDADDALTTTRRPWRYEATIDRPDESATYAVVYTSGTTGRPKASQVVHRASIHSGLEYLRLWRPRADDVAAVVFPLYYISAMHAHVLPVLLAGGRLVLIDEASPVAIADAVRRHQVTMLYVVPALWPRLLRVAGFRSPDIDHLRIGAFGGAHMPVPDIDAVRAALPHIALHDVYGLSETHSPATMLLDGEFAAKPGSVGRPLACMEAKVVDDDGRRLPPDTPGELWLRGSLVTTGYLHDPDATAAAITDGWFHTGDIARIDDDGFVTILDRIKEMINRGGNKVFSAEVERVLRDDPAIADVAVVAGTARGGVETVVAFVVVADDAAIDAATVRSLVTDAIAVHASPRQVVFVDELPRNSIGKVDKPVLRARARHIGDRDS